MLPRLLERLGKPGLKEFAQLGRSLELRNGVQFFECRRERIGETPDRSRPEFLIFWFEVQVAHGSCEVFRRLQFAFDERLVNHNFGGDIRQFTPLP